MPAGSTPSPIMFADAVGRLSMELPHNQAVSDLAYDYRAQNDVRGGGTSGIRGAAGANGGMSR